MSFARGAPYISLGIGASFGGGVLLVLVRFTAVICCSLGFRALWPLRGPFRFSFLGAVSGGKKTFGPSPRTERQHPEHLDPHAVEFRGTLNPYTVQIGWVVWLHDFLMCTTRTTNTMIHHPLQFMEVAWGKKGDRARIEKPKPWNPNTQT